MAKSAKALWLRQTEAARVAQVAVVVEVLSELGFMNERSLDLEPMFIAECAVKGVDINGCIEERDDVRSVLEQSAEAASTKAQDRPHFAKTVDVVEIETPVCPECGAPMVLRHGKFGEFWGCSSWRQGCRQTVSVK